MRLGMVAALMIAQVCQQPVVQAAANFVAQKDAVAFGEDQLRLADIYLRNGDPMQAVAPLLNVIRHKPPDAALRLRAQEKLLQAYVATGFFGSARRLLQDMPTPHRLAILLDAHTARPAELVDFDRQAVRAADLPTPLIIMAAKRAYALGMTMPARSLFARLATQSSDPRTTYYLGVLQLNAGDWQAARSAFARAVAVERNVAPDEHDAARLALARLLMMANEVTAAHQQYELVPSASHWFDRALYEQAWLYAAQGQTAAAAARLVQLAIDRPMSPLMPRAQLLYGALLLKLGKPYQADERFAAYIARYDAIARRTAELAATDSPRAFDVLYGDATGVFRQTREADIELVAWLQGSQRLRAAKERIEEIEAAMRELAYTTRVLRDVQIITEGWGLADDYRDIARIREQWQRLFDEFDMTADSLGARLNGRFAIAYDVARNERRELLALRNQLREMSARNAEKRQEIIGLTQYWLGGQWSVAGAPTTASRPHIEAWFRMLDQSDDEISRLQMQLASFESSVRAALLSTLEAIYPPQRTVRLRHLLWRMQTLAKRLNRIESAYRASRRETALQTRAELTRHLARLEAIYAQLRQLSDEALRVQNAVVVAECEAIHRFLRRGLEFARLGRADVATHLYAAALHDHQKLAVAERAVLARADDAFRSVERITAAPTPITQGETQNQRRVSQLTMRGDAAWAQYTALQQRLTASQAAVAHYVKEPGSFQTPAKRGEASLDFAWMGTSRSKPAKLYVDGRHVHGPIMLEAGRHRFDAVVFDQGTFTYMASLEAGYRYRLNLQFEGSTLMWRLVTIKEDGS